MFGMGLCNLQLTIATESLGWKTPLEVLTGNTPDISQLLQFQFYEPVYYATAAALLYADKPKFPSETCEGSGRIVGFGENVGDAFTYKILTDDTNVVIYRSAVRSAMSPMTAIYACAIFRHLMRKIHLRSLSLRHVDPCPRRRCP